MLAIESYKPSAEDQFELTVLYLLELGANPLHANMFGITTLDYAKEEAQERPMVEDCVKLMTEFLATNGIQSAEATPTTNSETESLHRLFE